MKKLFRITTVPVSLKTLLKGQLEFMNQYYDVTAIASDIDEESWETVAGREKVRCKKIRIERNISLLRDIQSLFRLYFYFIKEKPDIVHTHTPKAGLLGMLAAFLAHIPVRLHTVAGLRFMGTSGLKRQVLIFMERVTFFCAHKIYPNSKIQCEFIITNRFCPQKKIKVIANGSSNGIDTHNFNPGLFSIEDKRNLRKELNISEKDTVFIFIGRLVEDKGINELVSVFPTLASEYSIKLLLVGQYERELNPLLPQTEKIIDENPHIICTGYQADVRPYLAISDIFVFPSYREGLPNVVMQAGAMALPCIVTEINGCKEIIKDAVNGLIIPPKDEVALKEKMLVLLNDSNLCERLKSKAREMITSRYEQQMVWNALLEEYKLVGK
jgi:glycosyltransferase involved in cell wall biosynthesis